MIGRSRIADYGLIGDTRTAALVDSLGSIDWLCLPAFDGEPVFARLVAGDSGGRFAISPVDEARVTRRQYRPQTTILDTEWSVGSRRLLASDGMVADVSGSLLPTLCLVRRVEAHGGPVRVLVDFDPRFGDDRRSPRHRVGPPLVVSDSGGTALALAADPPLDIRPGGQLECEVEPGRPLVMVLSGARRSPLAFIEPQAAWRVLLEDAERWRSWTQQIQYAGPRSSEVERSLMTLRLLTYSPSGAPVAAPTTSLPEWPGGARNWDYRYAWPRDASIGIAAFLKTGLVDQARAFLYWLVHASRLQRPKLPALLTLHGRAVPAERELDWEGFDDSRPVRIGNDARGQHQLDNYGWVLDAMWLLVDAGHDLYGETWRAARALADEAARRWSAPDAGIWEVRGDVAHYVHSKAMAWLGLDRALRIARTHRTPGKQVARWRRERDAIGTALLSQGYDGGRSTFVQAFGRDDLDAALLLLPIIGIEPRDSPRLRGTIDAVRRELSAGGPLLYRYRGDDGLAGDEGAFLPCSFWLVQALAATGQVAEATEMFDELCSLGGPLGLFAEQVNPSNGEQLGNYPQAFTHATLVQAALALSESYPGPSRSPSTAP